MFVVEFENDEDFVFKADNGEVVLLLLVSILLPITLLLVVALLVLLLFLLLFKSLTL